MKAYATVAAAALLAALTVQSQTAVAQGAQPSGAVPGFGLPDGAILMWRAHPNVPPELQHLLDSQKLPHGLSVPDGYTAAYTDEVLTLLLVCVDGRGSHSHGARNEEGQTCICEYAFSPSSWPPCKWTD